jgi:formate hydrogenlyase subunit 6/NADH:ubiquinone oxidoreductase subunit I
MKELPELFSSKKDCCGCSACMAICPKEAITMIEDEEGFDYPVINLDKCIRCYQCLKVCPFNLG